MPTASHNFRPPTYFGRRAGIGYVLSRILGNERRERVRISLEQKLDIPSAFLVSQLPSSLRRYLSRFGGAYVAGEALPPLGERETEIARVSALLSMRRLEISVRVARCRNMLTYSIVDDGDDQSNRYNCDLKTRLPLTMVELVALIDGACANGGLVFGMLGLLDAQRARDPRREVAIEVKSEFYPSLQRFYEQRLKVHCD